MALTASNNSGTSTSVERAFELLDHIAAAGPNGLTLAELAAEVPTAKSTTHRYVTTLLELGVVRRDAAGRLLLGLRLVELAGALLDGDNLRLAAEPVLHELVARTGETVHLGVPSADGHVVYIAKVESPQSVRLVSRIGARIPMHCSAMGKALLALMDGPQLQAALGAPARGAHDAHADVGWTALLAELEKVRERRRGDRRRGERARRALHRDRRARQRHDARRRDQRLRSGDADDARAMRGGRAGRAGGGRGDCAAPGASRRQPRRGDKSR